MQDLLEYWHDTLSRDLAAYRDQGTDVTVEIIGSTLAVKWQTQETPHQATFRLDPTGDFRWAHDNATKTYLDFLASSGVSNLPQFSAATRRKFNQIDHLKYFVSPLCSEEALHDQRSPAAQIIIDQIQQAISQQTGRTKVIFLKGDAGSGKTTLLQHLTLERAKTYTAGAFQFLFVSAQGRALSNINDALAAETQSLKSAFTWEAVTPLTRHGLIVPIIDGFDELLGAVGYGDAFASLREFLDKLEGDGVVVVSARSSFYDVEFASRVDTYDTTSLVSVFPLSLLPWHEDLFKAFLEKKRQGDINVIDNDISIWRSLTNTDKNLLSKPFFASQFTNYVDSLSDAAPTKPILDFLIDAYIIRESEKIVDRDNRALLDPTGHRRFFEEIAENMWTGATRFVTSIELRVIAELVSSELTLSSDASEQFKYKVTSYAGVSVFQGDRFAFEHDVYFDYFLSIVLARDLEAQKLLFLNRALLPREVSEQIAYRISKKHAAINHLFAVQLDNVTLDNSRKNIGSLSSDLLRALGHLKAGTVTGVYFGDVRLDSLRVEDTRFVKCEFRRVDLSNTTFDHCTFEDCLGQALIVDNNTRFLQSKFLPDNGVQSILIRSMEREFFSPKEIVEKLVNIGAVATSEIARAPRLTPNQSRIVEILQNLERCYRRANPVCVDDDPGTNRLRSDPDWPKIETVLIRSGIVSPESKGTSGPPKRFLRLRYPLLEIIAAATKPQDAKDLPKTFWSYATDLRLSH